MNSIIRPGRDEDAEGFIALIGACWAQYPGVLMDVDGEMPELRALATWYAAKGGSLWAAEAEGRIAGMIAVRPLDAGEWEICRVYVHPSLHGAALGRRLLDTAEAHAIAAGATRFKLWSDTRFDRAHAFYEKWSYVRAGAIRVLDDISHSLEFAYAKPVEGLAVLDAAAASSAERRLAAILVACVEQGAAVSWLPPLAADTARAYWRRIARDVAAGEKKLLAAWAGGVFVGTVTLDLGTPPDQRHRAEVAMLLVLPSARRKGLGRALMQRLETEAQAEDRTLLTLATRAGDPAEALFRASGWQEAGRIPGYTLSSNGAPRDTAFFWKRLGTARPSDAAP
ncbi:MAG TPA: GNAT family N-acetyltransferase [Acetobacteraceae bacterium]|nr:GNAT family N-acetyltransferase [Acetobacteraceae bacterium]